jgi:hypothetical protein
MAERHGYRYGITIWVPDARITAFELTEGFKGVDQGIAKAEPTGFRGQNSISKKQANKDAPSR